MSAKVTSRLLSFVIFLSIASYGVFADPVKKVDYVRQLQDAIFTKIEKTNLTDSQLRQFVIDEYKQNIDFTWNARMALGSAWRQLSIKEQTEYINEYTKFLCYTWLPKLSYNKKHGIKTVIKNDTVKINDTDDNVIVHVITPDTKVYELILRIREYPDGTMRILNVALEGIDLALSYRSQFEKYNSPLSLIKDLKEKNNKMEKTVDFKLH